MYFGVFLPIGLVMKLLDRDPLEGPASIASAEPLVAETCGPFHRELLPPMSHAFAASARWSSIKSIQRIETMPNSNSFEDAARQSARRSSASCLRS